MRTKWGQEPESGTRMGTNCKVGTKTPKWDKNGMGTRMGTQWDKNGNKVGARTPKCDKNGNKVGTKREQEPQTRKKWDQSGNKNAKAGQK